MHEKKIFPYSSVYSNIENISLNFSEILIKIKEYSFIFDTKASKKEIKYFITMMLNDF